MGIWYDPWLTENEKNHLQVGQKGIRARQRMKNPLTAPAKQVDTVPGTSSTTAEERNRKRLSNAQRIRNGFNKR